MSLDIELFVFFFIFFSDFDLLQAGAYRGDSCVTVTMTVKTFQMRRTVRRIPAPPAVIARSKSQSWHGQQAMGLYFTWTRPDKLGGK